MLIVVGEECTIMKAPILLIIWLGILSYVSTSTILGIFPAPSKSHYIVGSALLKGLAGKGHDVTMISAYKGDIGLEKFFRTLHVPEILSYYEGKF